MIVANNVGLSDAYIAANEWKAINGVQVSLFGANNPIAYEIAHRPSDGSRDFMWGVEEAMAPGSQYWPGAIGIRCRNAVAGSQARVYVRVYEPIDPLGLGYTPFTGTVSASGGVSGVTPVPTGAILAWAAAVAPTGFVLCDGTHYNSLTDLSKAPLFALIGTTYGGTGSNDFAVPDLRGRMIEGLGTNAAVNALGLADATALANRRPQHRHTVSDPGHHHFVMNPGGGAVATRQDSTVSAAGTSGSPVGTTNSGGQGVADVTTGITVQATGTDNLDAPPFLVLNYIIAL